VHRIHFAGFQPGKEVIPLALACGVGERLPARHHVHGAFIQRIIDEGPQLWQASPLDQANVVVYPHRHDADTPETDHVARRAQQAGLPCLFFRHHDNSRPASPPYGVVYRTSIFADARTSCEYGMPADADDALLERDGQVIVRDKRSPATLGFCGSIGNPGHWLRCMAQRKFDNASGTAFRRRMVKRLRRSRKIRAQFIIRRRYWGGAVSRLHRDEPLQRRLRQEYVQNMVDSDYNLCVRGAGNFSLRFYETLSAGRIPLFINTQCVLPFDDQINWKNHCVWVEEDQIDHADEILADFHASVSPERFKQMQRANRQLWCDWLTPLSFYRRVIDQACAMRKDPASC